MSTKPFSAINSADKFKNSGVWQAFAYLDDQLKAYISPEANGIPLRQVMLLDGWAIDANGNLTPADVASQVKNYALVCSGTPAVTGVQSASWGVFDALYTELIMKIRFDAPPAGEMIFFQRKTSTNVPRITFGYHPDYGINCVLGTTTPVRQTSLLDMTQFFLNDEIVGEWVDVGFSLFADSAHFYLFANGARCEATQGFAEGLDTIPQTTTDTIELGCAGMSIAMCAWIVQGYTPFVPQTDDPINFVPPFERKRPPRSRNYWDCRPGNTVTELSDRAQLATYRANLTILHGAIEEVEMP